MNAPVVQVIVGLSFFFFIASVAASTINEFIANTLQLRARNLRHGLARLLGDRDEVNALLAHPVIASLRDEAGRQPSYIPTEAFTLALLHTHVPAALATPESVDADGVVPPSVEETLEKVPGPLGETLRSLWEGAARDVNAFQARVGKWFDATMTTASYWYRRRVQILLATIGLLMAIGLNLNSVAIANTLWRDASVRAAIVTSASTAAAATPGVDRSAGALVASARTSGLPMGWASGVRPTGSGALAVAVTGWLVTAIAVSFGAPFWFDFLVRLTRSAKTASPTVAS